MGVARFDAPWPDRLDHLCHLVAQSAEALALTDRFPDLVILAVRHTSMERWEVRGELPCSIDDFARAVAQQAPTLAIAVTTPSGPPAGRSQSLHTLIERDGARGLRIAHVNGDTGSIGFHFESLGTSRAPGWIGVAPTVDPGLVAIAHPEVSGSPIGET